MTNPEISLADQQSGSNESTTNGKILSYAEEFCRAMKELNAIGIGQTEGLLNIAVAAAEKYRSINPTAAASTQAKSEELAEFIDQMKNAADRMSRNNLETAEKAVQSAPNPETVLAVIEQALGNAIENSVSNQQALNQIGAAILARAATLLLSADGGAANKPAT